MRQSQYANLMTQTNELVRERVKVSTARHQAWYAGDFEDEAWCELQRQDIQQQIDTLKGQAEAINPHAPVSIKE